MSAEPIILFSCSDISRKTGHSRIARAMGKKINYAMMGIGVLFVVQIVSGLQILFDWVWHAATLYILYKIYIEKEFQHARNLVLAVLPVIIVSVLKDAVNLLPDSISDTLIKYVGFCIPFLFYLDDLYAGGI